MRIGIYGGSFNPPHKMHKDIPLLLIKNNYVDKVIYVPTGNNYNKKGLVDAMDRYNMLKLICNNSNLEVSDYEIKNKLVYTYQTLDYFKNIYKNDEIFLIMGSDNLNEIHSWKNYKYILDNYKILVVMRNDDKMNYDNVIFCNIDKKDISSTNIRKQIKEKDDNVLEKIDENVLKYILDRNLYMG